MKGRPRWVIDTNVLVSAFLWRGTAGRIIELAGEGEVQLCASRILLDELAATLKRFHDIPIVMVAQALKGFAGSA